MGLNSPNAHGARPLSRRTVLAGAAALAAAPYAGLARAAATVRVGQVLPLSSPLAAVVKPILEGQKALIDSVNAQGGVNGSHIELVTLDDAAQPERTVEHTGKLLADDSLACLFGYGFVPGLLKALPAIDEGRMPLIGVYNGADILRTAPHPALFTTTASLGDEIATMVNTLATLDMRRLAVAYHNNELGRYMVPQVQALADQHQATLVAVQPIEPDGSNASKAAAAIDAAHPQAILLLAAGAAALGFMRTRDTNARVPIYALSLTGTTALLEQLGPVAHGMAFTQVVPYPKRFTTPLTRRFGAAMQASHLPPTYDRMWGYLNASILVEVLHRSGAKPGPASVTAAIEGMNDVDIGGYRLGFGKQRHNGSSFVEITMVDGRGNFIR